MTTQKKPTVSNMKYNSTLPEKIIEAVKQNPILYDLAHPDNKNHQKRLLVWTKVANDLMIPTDELKKKWKNIRDCYLKYLRSIESNPNSKRNYSNWQWASEMESFRPYFFHKVKTQCDLETDIDIKSEHFDDMYEDDRMKGFDEMSDNYPMEPQLTIQEEPKFYSQMDAVDLTFLGHAKTVKRFSLKRQAVVKMKIAKLLMEEELAHIDEVSQ